MKVSNLELKYLSTVSNTVDEFLKSKNKTVASNHELFKIISRCLTHVTPDMNFSVNLLLSPHTENPFIMGIYPSLEELDAKSKNLLQYMNEGKTGDFIREWASIKNWVIEIDSRVLTKGNRLCVDDGDQFVALLCHELGHAVSGNPINLMKNYIYQKKILNKVDNMLMVKNPLIRKFALPMFVAMSQFKIVLSGKSKDMREEIMADHYVPEEYREALLSYIENHIITSPESSELIITEEDLNSAQNTAIRFNKEIVGMMQRRRDTIKHSIKAQYDNGSSKYMNSMVSKIGKISMGYNPETDESNDVYEKSMVRTLEKDIMECAEGVSVMMESASVTQRDISVLMLQVDSIETVDQKLFVVHTIYDYLEILQAQREKLLKKSSNQGIPLPQDNQIKVLNEILEKVMKKNVSDVGDRYGIFVKYPKGYEG